MSDTSGCPVRPQVSSIANPVHKPSSLPTSKGTALGKQWVPPAKEISASASVGTLGGEPGSAFAKYVRRDKSQDHRSSAGHSDDPETTCDQPSSAMNRAQMPNDHPASTLRSHSEKIPEGTEGNEGNEENAEECSNSSSQSSADSEGTNSKHSSKKRSRSDTSSQSKKQRLIWTPELHARFLAAVNHLGVKNAVPKTILQLMNVEGMTRENVASHLQKYRLYLKRLAGLPPNIPLSAETMHQVQSVQAALHQQVQVGLQTNQALQLAASQGGMPLASLATLPVQGGGIAGYHDLLGQLAGCSYAGGIAGMPGTASLQPQMLYQTGAAADGSLSALSRGQLEGALGFIPGGLIPINLCQLAMPGLGGLQPAATLLGTHQASGLGVMSPLTLAHAPAQMRQGGEASLGVQPARHGNMKN